MNILKREYKLIIVLVIIGLQFSFVPHVSATIPSSLSLNSFFNEEFSTTDSWSGSFTIENGAAKIPNSTTIQKTATFPNSGDWILYLKIKSTHTSNFYGYLAINEGANPSPLNLIVDYDWVDGVAELGTISASINGGAIKKTLLTGADTSNYIELAVQFDSKYNVFNFFSRNGSAFTYLDSADAPSITGAKNIKFVTTGNGSGDRFIYVDYITLAYPNIIAIGDSITAGHPDYDPDPDFYAGKDPYEHSYESHINAYESDRNTLIVNKGVGSQNSSVINGRIASDVVAHNPQIAILQASNNDYTPFTLAQRTTNIQASINTLYNAGISVILTNSIVPQSVSADYYKTWNANYFPGMENVDVYADIMTDIANENGQIADAYRDDTVHPNIAGHTLIGSAIETAISNAIIAAANKPTSPLNIKANNSTNPNDISSALPLLSAEYDDPNSSDTALYYQVQVIEQGGNWNAPLWDSTKTATTILEGNRQEITYGGTSLTLNGNTYYQRWRFWDSDGNTGDWSDGTNYWTMRHVIQNLTEWEYRKKITIDGDLISGNLSNFPVLIDITDSNLTSHAQLNGYDILFTSSSTNWNNDTEENKLNHEIESYDSGTGKLVAWVEVPSLVEGEDTEIYMYYGNSDSGNQENTAAVWDENYTMVHHLEEDNLDGTSGEVVDSTSNDIDGTSSGSPTSTSTGKIGNAITFDGTNGYISLSQTQTFTAAQSYTIETWGKLQETSSDFSRGMILGDTSDTTDFLWLAYNGGYVRFRNSSGSDYDWTGITDDWVDTNWHYYVFTANGTQSTLFIDGQNKTSKSGSTALQINAIAKGYNNSNYNFRGTLDEIRISNTIRSDDYITTAYTNQNNPSAFVSLDSEEYLPSAPSIGNPIAISSTSIRWNFTDSASNETGFKIYDNTNTLATSSATANLSYLDETGLSENTQYSGRYAVAYNSAGESSHSSAASAIYTLADTPTNLSASSNSNSVTLSVDSFPNNTSGQSGYYFSRSGVNSGWIQTNSWTDTGLSCGHSYDYSVIYRNGDGTETSSISTTKSTSGCGGGGMPAGWSNLPIVPTGGFKVLINSGANTTTNRIVNLSFNAGSDVKKMAISLTGDFADASQENYLPTKQIDLCSKLGGLVKNQTCPDGTYKVYVKFFTYYGQASNVASSTIVLKSGSTTTENLQQYANLPFSNPFTKYLQYRQSSPDIKRLQIFLNSDPDTKLADSGVGSPGKETNYFGTLTFKAVIKFQEKYAKDVLAPWGFAKGTGYVGKTTLAKINELMGNK